MYPIRQSVSSMPVHHRHAVKNPSKYLFFIRILFIQSQFLSPASGFLSHFQNQLTSGHYILVTQNRIWIVFSIQCHTLDITVFIRKSFGHDLKFLSSFQMESRRAPVAVYESGNNPVRHSDTSLSCGMPARKTWHLSHHYPANLPDRRCSSLQ